jgi:hypothetical protein
LPPAPRIEFRAGIHLGESVRPIIDENAHPSKCRLLGGHREWLTCGQSDANDPLKRPQSLLNLSW